MRSVLCLIALIGLLALTGCKLEPIGSGVGSTDGSPILTAVIQIDCPRCDVVGLHSSSGPAPLTVNLWAKLNFEPSRVGTYNWDYGDGARDYGITRVSHTYNNVGSYLVKLMVSTVDGTTITDSYPINVTTAPLYPNSARVSGYVDSETNGYKQQPGWCKAQLSVSGAMLALDGNTITVTLGIISHEVDDNHPPIMSYIVSLNPDTPFFKIEQDHHLVVTNGVNAVIRPGVENDYVWTAHLRNGFKLPTTLSANVECGAYGTIGAQYLTINMAIAQ